jgi:hypothetical protein
MAHFIKKLPEFAVATPAKFQIRFVSRRPLRRHWKQPTATDHHVHIPL